MVSVNIIDQLWKGPVRRICVISNFGTKSGSPYSYFTAKFLAVASTLEALGWLRDKLNGNLVPLGTYSVGALDPGSRTSK
jgi:hypothetical protein